MAIKWHVTAPSHAHILGAWPDGERRQQIRFSVAAANALAGNYDAAGASRVDCWVCNDMGCLAALPWQSTDPNAPFYLAP